MNSEISLLYVEDDSRIRSQFSTFFRRRFRRRFKRVYVASNGEEGLSIYREYRADIVITDVRMPKLNGLDMLKEIKLLNPNVKSIVITAFSEEHFLIQSIELGISKYILKPMKKSKVEEALSEVIKLIQVERDTKAKKHQIQYILDSQDNMLILTDGENLTLANQKLLDFLGYENLEEFKLEHNCICDFFQDEDGFISDEGKNGVWIDKVIQNKSKNSDSKVKMFNRVFLIKLSEFPFENSRYILTLTDITKEECYREDLEYKIKDRTWKLIELNDELEDRKSRLEEAEKIAHIGHWNLNVKSRELLLSDEIYRILDTHLQKISYRTILKRVPKSELEVIKNLHFKALKRSFHFQVTIKTFKNRFKTLHIYGKNIFDDNLKLVRVFGTAQDITELKKIEEKQEEQNRLLIQQSKMAQMGEMIGAIAHQWKQPLNSLSLTIQSLEYDFEDGEVDAKYVDNFVSSSIEQIQFMSDTIDNFRNFFKPSKEQKRFNINFSIESVLKIVKKQLENRYIEIEFIQDRDLYSYGYSNEFKQVILNLLTNSRDSIEERKLKKERDYRGKIVIKSYRDLKYNYIDVIDNGVGLDSEIEKHLFKAYKSTKGDAGTGIGLNLSKTIIEKMDGEIYFQTQKEGVKFGIKLPKDMDPTSDIIID